MKLFCCQNCGQVLYFENVRCERCALDVGYLPRLETLSAVQPEGEGWMPLAHPGHRYRFCKNWEASACNWLVEERSDETFCLACRHNRTVPDVSDPAQHALWVKVETAKRRLFYSLFKLGIAPWWPGSGDHEPLVFDFLKQITAHKVITGHDNGIVTIALEEADDAVREKVRTRMDETYRTLLGHFRHEVGHYYWDRLVRDRGQIAGFRAIFGDERQDYQQAMTAYYANGPQANWQDSHITAYATMHPWEDFAETWSHYLHIVDALEMAFAFGISVSPRVATDAALSVEAGRDPYTIDSMDDLIAKWLPIVFAVNSINRSMGQSDLYPFVLPPPVAAKLGFIRRMITDAAREARQGQLASADEAVV